MAWRLFKVKVSHPRQLQWQWKVRLSLPLSLTGLKSYMGIINSLVIRERSLCPLRMYPYFWN